MACPLGARTDDPRSDCVLGTPGVQGDMKTWSGEWVIPKHIKLPGCRVKVRLVESSVIEGCEGAAVYSHSKDECVILIDSTLPLATQRYVLLHELQHVMVEVLDIMLEKYPEHVQLARARHAGESK